MTRNFFIASLTVVLGMAALAAAAPQRPAAKGRGKTAAPAVVKPAHPEVDPAEACDACHAEVTPQVHQEWFAGRHGMNNVKCFVCHGSVGADFVRRAPVERCIGCHGEQVASMAHPVMAGKDCFSCHPPHLLSPHRLARGVTGGAQ